MPNIPGTLVGIYENHIERYRFAAAGLSEGLVIDAGCGCGYGSLLIPATARYCGLDRDADAIEYALLWYSGHGRAWFVHDLVADQWPEFLIDARRIIALEIIEHLPREHWESVLDDFRDALAPGGDIVLSCPVQPVGISHPRPYHEYEPTETEITGLVADRWRVKTVHYQPIGVPEITSARPTAERWQVIIKGTV